MKLNLKGVKHHEKSFILKSLSALIILSSVGVAKSAVSITHNVAHA